MHLTEDKQETGFGISDDDILTRSREETDITFSSAVDVVLSLACRNKCGYCRFSKRNQDLTVPYSTIKTFKAAKKAGAREAHLVAGERPDKFHAIRAKFDVWGFNSYIEYIYTIAELAFLEGLLVNLEVGYLSLTELKYLKEIITSVEMSLESTNRDFLQSVHHQYSPSKDPNIRIKFIENAGKLNIPTNTGILIGIGESPEERIRAFVRIKDLHEEYGHIQSVKINTFVPEKNTPMSEEQPVSDETLYETIRLAREIMPKDVDITIPVNIHQDIIKLVEHGVNDLGQIRVYGRASLFPKMPFKTIEEYQAELALGGYTLHKQLPIKNQFILAQKYSKKLGQFLDKHRAKLKDNMREDKFMLTF